MADLVFNVAKGRGVYYGSLPATSDAIIVVPLEASGLVSDATMRDYTDLASLLAGASNEQTTAGRKTLASVTITVDQTNDRVDVDGADLVWSGLTGNQIGALVFCYDPDTGSGTDSDLIPLVKLDCSVTPDGTDFTAQLASAGWYRAA
jgi:hypothetical protein